MTDGGDANTRFLKGVDKWIKSLGNLREIVRQQVVATQLSEIFSERGIRHAEVLDVGCGQGTQALLLARAGHEITGLDISPKLLSQFETTLAAEPVDVRTRVRLVHGPGEAAPKLVTGPFDVILCHGVLMYLDDAAPMLNAISRVAKTGTILSLLVRNGLATAMRDGLRWKWNDALTAFDNRHFVNRLGLAACAHTPEDLDQALARHHWRRDEWHGVRVFTDHWDDEIPPPDELLPLLAAEREAGRRDPYRQVAAMLHIIYRRH